MTSAIRRGGDGGVPGGVSIGRGVRGAGNGVEINGAVNQLIPLRSPADDAIPSIGLCLGKISIVLVFGLSV